MIRITHERESAYRHVRRGVIQHRLLEREAETLRRFMAITMAYLDLPIRSPDPGWLYGLSRMRLEQRLAAPSYPEC